MYRHPLIFAATLGLLVTAGLAQQNPDTRYKPPVPRPAYEIEKGPVVAVDQGHHNFHTAKGRYLPFVNLLKRDGYRAGGLKTDFDVTAQKVVDVLVIANALHKRNANNWSLPTPSAFTSEEIATIHAWVEQGGSLFLIADHMPFPGAAGELAKAFGFEFSNGYARTGNRGGNQQGDRFKIGKGLMECAVTQGRDENERVTEVATFGGSAFKIPENAVPVMAFGKGSYSIETRKAPGITPGSPEVNVNGWCQGALIEVGKGRVAVFGEASMFSAQVAGPSGSRKMGMNHPEAKQNYQFLLNVMHWLTRAEGMPD